MGDPDVKKTPWNQTPPPNSMTEGMQKSRDQREGSAGSAYISSVETPQRSEETGGMRSAQTTQAIGRGGVGKSTLKTPPAEPMPTGLMDGGKY